MTLSDKFALVFLILFVVLVIQAYRAALYARESMYPDTNVLTTTIKMMIPSFKKSLKGVTLVPLEYWFRLMTGSTLVGIKAVVNTFKTMSDEQLKGFNSDIDNTIDMMKYFVVPRIVEPTTSTCTSFKVYLEEAAIVVDTLKRNVNSGDYSDHVTQSFVLRCRSSNIDFTEGLRLVGILALGVERDYIETLIKVNQT